MAHLLGLTNAPKTSPWFAMIVVAIWQELQTRGEVWVTGLFTYNALWLICLCWAMDFIFGTMVAIRDSLQHATVSDRDPWAGDNRAAGFHVGSYWWNEKTKVNWALHYFADKNTDSATWRPYRRNIWQARAVGRSLARFMMWFGLVCVSYSMRLSGVVGFGAFATFLEGAIVLAEVTSVIRNIGKLMWAAWLERYARAAEQGRDNLAYKAEAIMTGEALAGLTQAVNNLKDELPQQVATKVVETIPEVLPTQAPSPEV